jgi:alpha-ketoglutarate-dependent taurine dioxygenase
MKVSYPATVIAMLCLLLLTNVNSFATRRTKAFSPFPLSGAGLTTVGKTLVSLPYQSNNNENAKWVHSSDEAVAEAYAVPKKIVEKPSISLNSVKMYLLPTAQKDGSKSEYPLVISPKSDASQAFLTQFLERNRQWVDAALLSFGAVLFRGFDIDTVEKIETSIRSFEPNLNNSYRGTSPRNAQEGSRYIFSAAEVPSTYPIAQHLEMSFLPSPPKRLFFGALKAPKVVGGETSLADFRRVYRDIPVKLRNKLDAKKLRYTRTHQRTGSRFTSDVASMQSWEDVFGMSDKTEVEQMARDENMPVRWEGRNHDTFVSEFVSEPFQLHPETKEAVWFNHVQVFHWTSFPAELLLAFLRTKEWRFLARSIAVGLQSMLLYGMLGKKMALNVTFGDGTPISLLEMHQIRSAIRRNMVFNRWQQGDLIMIDNFSTSHGRQPTYDKGRKVVVAWSDPLEKRNEMVAENA